MSACFEESEGPADPKWPFARLWRLQRRSNRLWRHAAMTIETNRSQSTPEGPLPLACYIALLRMSLAVLAVIAVSWGNARASESQPQYHGFSATANYDRIKQGIMSALIGCVSKERNAEFVAPKIIKIKRAASEFYPTEARMRGEQAVITISFLDDSLGNIRFLHVDQALPMKPDPQLIAAAIQVVRSYALTPASLNGEPISYWTGIPVKFILQDVGGPMGSLLKQDAWLAMLDKANAGDVQSIVDSGYVAEMVSGETGLSRNGELSLIVDSALHGADFARMQLYDLLSVCSQEAVVEPWVSADAKAGSLQAEMTLAQITWAKALASGSEASQVEKITDLLRTVAEGTDPFYRLWAAGVLATEPGLRDPATALKVAVALNENRDAGHEYDPDYLELLAAAQAANGKFAAAVQAELTAIGWARHMGWNVKLMESRLMSYQAQRAWFGHLCDCQQIAPDFRVGVK